MKEIIPTVKSCATCRWVGCRNYGKGCPICIKYIPETKLAEKEN